MTVIPLKMNKMDSAISPMFGHAKWIAFIDDAGEITIEKNPTDGGQPFMQWLLDRGFDTVVTQHMGPTPYQLFTQRGVEIYYPGEGRVTMIEALDGLREGRLERVTEANFHLMAGGHHH